MARWGKGHSLSVIAYHSVTAGASPLNDWCYIEAANFDRQMRWLAQQPVDVLPLNDAVRALSQGQLRRNTVALTFDDGYRDNVEVALPVLRQHGFPATIFLTTGLIGTNSALWHGRIISALERSKKPAITWHGTTMALSTPEERCLANTRLQAMIKIHAAAQPNVAAAEIEQLLDVPEVVALPDTSPHAMLSTEGLHRAKASGLISFGAHSVTHPLLSAIDDTRLAAEMLGSIDAVEAMTGQRCTSFAYPNGRRRDFDARAVALLQSRGIEIALTTVAGPNHQGADQMRLCRWSIGQKTSFSRFKAKLSGHAAELLRARLNYWGMPGFS